MALKDLRAQGYTAQIVERWNQFAKVRQDLFGVIDILAIKPGEILGVQATSGVNHNARRTKSLASENLKLWLTAGGKYAVWSYAKRGERGKRKLWTRREEEIRLEDFV